jgi:hypothetical protein
MPQSRPPESSARRSRSDDDWEIEAVAIASKLDAAAEELRRLIADIREDRKSREDPP